MRIRTLKPEFWTNEELANLDEFTRLAAIALLNYSDDEGFFKANAELIRGAIFPFEKNSTRIQRALVELSNIRFLALYSGTDGRTYGQVLTFAKHQKIDRPSASKIKPLVNFDEPSSNPQRSLGLGTGNREQGKDSSSEAPVGAPSTPTIDEIQLIFPTVGSPANWPLLMPLVARWQDAFPGVDVGAECKVALEWCKANPAKQKTARGMERFLFAWLERCQNRGGRSPLNHKYENHRPSAGGNSRRPDLAGNYSNAGF